MNVDITLITTTGEVSGASKNKRLNLKKIFADVMKKKGASKIEFRLSNKASIKLDEAKLKPHFMSKDWIQMKNNNGYRSDNSKKDTRAQAIDVKLHVGSNKFSFTLHDHGKFKLSGHSLTLKVPLGISQQRAIDLQHNIEAQFYQVMVPLLRMWGLKLSNSVSPSIHNIVAMARFNKSLNLNSVDNYIISNIRSLPREHPHARVGGDSPQFEIIPFMKLTIPGSVLRVDSKGNMTALKQKTINNLINNIVFTKQFLDTIPGAWGRAVNAKVHKNVKKRAGSSCVPSRRPNPNLFTGKCKEGYIILPNKEGAPCCFKIPKNITTVFKRKIVDSYAQFSIPIPREIRSKFDLNDELTRNNKYILPNLSMRKKNGKNTLYIGNRTANRLTKAQLVRMLKELQKPFNGDKPQLIRRIENIAKSRNLYKKNNRPTIKVGRKTMRVTMTGDVLKLDNKTCTFYKRDELIAILRALRVPVPEGTTKPDLCKLIKNKIKFPTRVNKRGNAASKIAAAVRGKRARNSIKRQKQRQQQNNNNQPVWVRIPRNKNNARMVIKGAAEGLKARKEIKKSKKAATVVAAAFRGMRNRGAVRQKIFNNILNQELAMSHAANIRNNLNNSDKLRKNKAAKKIQNAMKRYTSAREKISNTREKIHQILPSNRRGSTHKNFRYIMDMPNNNFSNLIDKALD